MELPDPKATVTEIHNSGGSYVFKVHVGHETLPMKQHLRYIRDSLRADHHSTSASARAAGGFSSHCQDAVSCTQEERNGLKFLL